MQRTIYLKATDPTVTEAPTAWVECPPTRDLLTVKIEDGDAYLLQVRGKALKAQFKRLLRAMTAGDELWEWSWSAERGGRFSYSYGWCVMRNGEVIAEELIHDS